VCPYRPFSKVDYLLWVSQIGKLSLPSPWGWLMSSHPCIYIDYGGGDHEMAMYGCIATGQSP